MSITRAPSAAQIKAERAYIERAREDDRREAVAMQNREDGKAAPRPGDRLFVTTVRGIKRRSRAGIVFSADGPVQVQVLDVSDEEIAKRQKGGETVVNVAGAEDVLADTGPIGGLMVVSAPASLQVAEVRATADAEITKHRTRAEAAEARIAELERNAVEQTKRQAELERKLAEAAAPKGDGSPERLKAADKGKDK